MIDTIVRNIATKQMIDLISEFYLGSPEQKGDSLLKILYVNYVRHARECFYLVI